MDENKIGCRSVFVICIVIALVVFLIAGLAIIKTEMTKVCTAVGYDEARTIDGVDYCIRETETGLVTIRYDILLQQLGGTE